MKKLIILGLLLTGCGYSPLDYNKDVIITDIQTFKNRCYYYAIPTNNERGTPKGYFVDKCGKYTVGDTITTIKKKYARR